jgi:ABC-type phosphate transport system substrate-binding protein
VTFAGVALAGIALIAIAFATSGGATVPAAGINCQADGKFSGRGATFQKRAQDAFNAGYTADVCGNVSDTASGNLMTQYNVYDGVAPAPVLTGSGYGRKAAICRADAFAGTDVPYSTAQVLALDGDPHAQANLDVIFGGTAGTRNCQSATGTGFGTAFYPPYQPQNGVSPNPSSYPAAGDATANLMSFPVAGSAVAIGFNLKGAGICTGTPPSSLSLTAAMVSLLFGGDIKNWDAPALEAGGLNPGLANCHGAVTRVVRLDDSGTTQIFKNYLSHIDGGRTNAAATCDTGTTWSSLAGVSPNTTWPGFVPSGTAQQGVAATGTCSAIDTGDVNGNNGVLDVCDAVIAGTQPIAGAICYADLPDLRAFTCTGTCPVVAASVRNASDTSFQAPSAVSRANCSFGAIFAPSGGNSGAVGLNVSGTPDTWATDNSTGNHGDVTNTGTVYPICGVTFDLVYSGLSAGAGSGAISGLSNDQRRAMYSYFTYVLSSTGQATLNSKFYQSLPTALVDNLRAGFQANF